MKREQRKRLTINLDEADLNDLHALARKADFTTSEYLRRHIRRLVEADRALFMPTAHEQIMHTASIVHAELAR